MASAAAAQVQQLVEGLSEFDRLTMGTSALCLSLCPLPLNTTRVRR